MHVFLSYVLSLISEGVLFIIIIIIIIIIIKLYCAWSSFLQNWDRRNINKMYLLFLSRRIWHCCVTHINKHDGLRW